MTSCMQVGQRERRSMGSGLGQRSVATRRRPVFPATIRPGATRVAWYREVLMNTSLARSAYFRAANLCRTAWSLFFLAVLLGTTLAQVRSRRLNGPLPHVPVCSVIAQEFDPGGTQLLFIANLDQSDVFEL